MKENGLLSILKTCTISLCIGLSALLVFISAAAGIALATNNPDQLILPLSLTCLALSSITMGFSAGKITDDSIIHPLLSSVITGAFFVVILLFTSIFFSSGASISLPLRLAAYIAIIIVNLLGCVIGRPKAKNISRRIKHSRRR